MPNICINPLDSSFSRGPEEGAFFLRPQGNLIFLPQVASARLPFWGLERLPIGVLQARSSPETEGFNTGKDVQKIELERHRR